MGVKDAKEGYTCWAAMTRWMVRISDGARIEWENDSGYLVSLGRQRSDLAVEVRNGAAWIGWVSRADRGRSRQVSVRARGLQCGSASPKAGRAEKSLCGRERSAAIIRQGFCSSLVDLVSRRHRPKIRVMLREGLAMSRSSGPSVQLPDDAELGGEFWLEAISLVASAGCIWVADCIRGAVGRGRFGRAREP
jgi:hypothetical protein